MTCGRINIRNTKYEMQGFIESSQFYRLNFIFFSVILLLIHILHTSTQNAVNEPFFVAKHQKQSIASVGNNKRVYKTLRGNA